MGIMIADQCTENYRAVAGSAALYVSVEKTFFTVGRPFGRHSTHSRGPVGTAASANTRIIAENRNDDAHSVRLVQR